MDFCFTFSYNLIWYIESGSAVNDPGNSPAVLQLSVAPNPFSKKLNLSFESASKSAVDIDIFDLRGRLIRSEHGISSKQGTNSWLWDGKDNSGQKLDNGVYLIKVKSGDQQGYIKTTLLN